MRVSTAFNTMLAIPGSTVTAVSFESGTVVAQVRLPARYATCPCGRRARSVYDRSTRRWRHLDLGGTRLHLEATIRRVSCRACRRVRTEVVPWARPGARHSRDLQDLIAYLAQRMDKTTVTRLLRVSWQAVDKALTDPQGGPVYASPESYSVQITQSSGVTRAYGRHWYAGNTEEVWSTLDANGNAVVESSSVGAGG